MFFYSIPTRCYFVCSIILYTILECIILFLWHSYLNADFGKRVWFYVHEINQLNFSCTCTLRKVKMKFCYSYQFFSRRQENSFEYKNKCPCEQPSNRMASMNKKQTKWEWERNKRERREKERQKKSKCIYILPKYGHWNCAIFIANLVIYIQNCIVLCRKVIMKAINLRLACIEHVIRLSGAAKHCSHTDNVPLFQYSMHFARVLLVLSSPSSLTFYFIFKLVCCLLCMFTLFARKFLFSNLDWAEGGGNLLNFRKTYLRRIFCFVCSVFTSVQIDSKIPKSNWKHLRLITNLRVFETLISAWWRVFSFLVHCFEKMVHWSRFTQPIIIFNENFIDFDENRFKIWSNCWHCVSAKNWWKWMWTYSLAVKMILNLDEKQRQRETDRV